MSPARILALNAAASFYIALALEFHAFPWSIMQGMSNYPWHVTLISYLLAALIVTILCSAIPSLLSRHFQAKLRSRSSTLKRLTTTYAASSAVGLVINILLFSGPGLFLRVPGTRLRSIFFAEFQFLTFAFHVGLPVCLVATGIYAWGLSKPRLSDR